MRRSYPLRVLVSLLLPLACTTVTSSPNGSRPNGSASADAAATQITLREGTSMSVGVSPDGQRLVIDLQGTLWVFPAGGGEATAITDGFDDARQPIWSPDGRRIVFQGYRAGGYDVWTVAPDGSGLAQLTSDDYDDREPAWSHDGTRVAFASDRGGGSYDIWTIDARSGELRQITRSAVNEEMPSWSPDDREIAFARTGNEAGVWVVNLSSGAERRLTPRGSAPSWGPDGQLVYHVSEGGSSRLELDGATLTGDENAFPFRASWAGANTFFYTADGKVRRRSLGGSAAQTVEFAATVTVTRAAYQRRVRDFTSRSERRALGIVAPRISPDGNAVAFVALGDLWMQRRGGRPERLTRDAAMDMEPSWSPDGGSLVYSTDRAGGVLQLWIRELRTGAERQLTHGSLAAMGAVWSPDGRRIAFLEVDGQWRRATVSLVDVATGEVTQLQRAIFGPGVPTWSPDGRWIAIAQLNPYSSRFREGMNQIRLIPAAGGEPRWMAWPAHRTLDSRVGGGPVWSPDGSKVAYVAGGQLWVQAVTAAGDASGEPRRITSELAHMPSWAGDSRRILYQANDRLRVVEVETGATTDMTPEISYRPDVPSGRLVVHAGRLFDGVTPELRADMDVLIEDNRIARVEPHRDANHDGREVADASGLTLMPGLIEYHSHLQPDLGEAHGRAWLSFGITTVRSPGATPYEAVEQREAVHAGTRLGPRIYTAGYLMEWQRAYYKMSTAVQNDAHLEMELERARVLEHDMIKSYVRMPDLQQKRIVEFAHAMGVPSSSHEIYPSTRSGIDGVEHTTGTSRRGYSPKVGTLQRSYSDVTSLIGAAGLTFTPTFALSATWLRRLFDVEPSLRTDPRFGLLPIWITETLLQPPSGEPLGRPTDAGPVGELVMNAKRAGARIVAGTDTPNPASLHGELLVYVAAGMTPFEALQTATVTPAAALGLNAGSVEAGRLADLVAVDGNPLQDITYTQRVRFVIANGRLLTIERLLGR